MTRNRKPIDIVGKRYNRLTVLEQDPNVPTPKKNGKREIYWKCLCDCGNTISLQRDQLVGGHRRDCGCEPTRYKQNYKSVNRLEGDIAAFNRLYQAYEANAKTRGFTFGLSKEEFRELTKKNCSYCGAPPSQIKEHKVKSPRDPYIYNGIDRLDSSIGYFLTNCTPCCGVCNMMKQTHSPENFIEHVAKIYNYQKDLIA